MSRPVDPTLEYDAIILSGGRGSRLGGTAKGALVIEGRSLLTRALEATRYAAQRVVVGDGPVPDGVRLTREQPAYAGPAAAVAAGLAALNEALPDSLPDALPDSPPVALSTLARSRWTLVLACDTPQAADGIPLLVEAVSAATARSLPTRAQSSGTAGKLPDGWCLIDSQQRLQWLFGLYRTEALEQAVRVLGDPADSSMRRLLGSLRLQPVPAPAHVFADINTPEELSRWTR